MIITYCPRCYSELPEVANYCPICGMDLIKKEELEVRYVGPKGENYCYGSETHISDRKQEKRGGELIDNNVLS